MTDSRKKLLAQKRLKETRATIVHCEMHNGYSSFVCLSCAYTAVAAQLGRTQEALEDLLEYVPEDGATIGAGYGPARKRAVRVLTQNGNPPSKSLGTNEVGE